MPRNAVSPVVGVLVPLVVAALAVVFTSRSLDRGEIA
jgi:hypothetical protein